jgi:hypothetical protein
MLRVRVRLPESFDEAAFDADILSRKDVFGYSWE